MRDFVCTACRRRVRAVFSCPACGAPNPSPANTTSALLTKLAMLGIFVAIVFGVVAAVTLAAVVSKLRTRIAQKAQGTPPPTGASARPAPADDTPSLLQLLAPPRLALATTWASVPAPTSGGLLVGLVRTQTSGGERDELVALDEAAGTVRWRSAWNDHAYGSRQCAINWTSHGPPLSPTVRAGRGRARHTLLVVYGGDWHLIDAATGVQTDGAQTTYGASMGVADACANDAEFWFQVHPDYDDGIRLSRTGLVEGPFVEDPILKNKHHTRFSRPAGCPVPAVAPPPSAIRTSPQQRLRGDRQDPICVAAGRNKGHEHCDLTGAVPGGPTVALFDNHLYVDGTHVSLNPYTEPVLEGIEAGVEQRIFVTLSALVDGTRRQVLFALSAERQIEWQVMLGLAGDSPLVVASPAESPTQNLYVFRPGSVIALDQRTGVGRFRAARF